MKPTPSLLARLLAPGSLHTMFQPIYELRGEDLELHMLECLSRGPRGTNLSTARLLFDYARRKGQESILDRLCVEVALRSVAEAGLSRVPRLALNLHASTLAQSPEFPDFLANCAASHAIQASCITVEIVEHAPAHAGPGFLEARERLRALGMTVALDDIGMGQSNFRMILDCEPDYLKVDRHLVHACHSDPKRQAVLEALLLLARRLGAKLVAEGVESKQDYLELRRLGIELVQGFLFSLPVAASALPELCPA